VGPPDGGFVNAFLGKQAMFLILVSVGIFDGLLQLLIIQPKEKKSKEEGASLLSLVKDPYILIAAGTFSLVNTLIAIVETSLPVWMINTMHLEDWEIGTAFFPLTITYLIATLVFGRISNKIGRWLCSMIGLIIGGIALICVMYFVC
jgi:MFS transporter, DHA1 family, solute carrier family 18 (vesicular amine transporter), member 1/2